MKEITQENYKELELDFRGIVLGIPMGEKYNADFYLYGHKIDKENKSIFQMIAYNQEDGTIDGLSTEEISFEHIFHFEGMHYIQFNNFGELCLWFLENVDQEPLKEFFTEYDTPYSNYILDENILNISERTAEEVMADKQR